MTSVIAGKYKGRKLFDVKNLHVRPTQAKVRKSIFQILEPFDGLEVLDLYAGVGTLGIEAMSRGASRVVFVEKNRRVFKVLKKNIDLFEPENSKLILVDHPNSFLIFEANFCSSSSSDEPNIVKRYSNALPFPVIPTFVKVEAGNNPRRISSAFALVEPL